MRCLLVFIALLSCLVFDACNRYATGETQSQSSPQRDKTCSDFSQADCQKNARCLHNADENRCETKILWQTCSDLKASSFQCIGAELGHNNLYGCVYRSSSCEKAAKCSDLNNLAQCGRAKAQGCVFSGGSCKEKPSTSILPLLNHSDPVMQKWFYEAFTAFGAYLNYYQELAKTKDKAGIAVAINDAFGVGLPDDGANNAWLGTPKNAEFIGDLDAIDASITDPSLRAIWESWARNPDNFLSWIIYPVAWKETTDLADLNNKYLKLRHHGILLMWGDDGLCMFSWIMNLKVAKCPKAPVPRPDPNKWLQKIQTDVAITKP